MTADGTPFDTARGEVGGGVDPAEAAASVVAAMSDDEKLWCLDGDAPTWAGLGFMREGGYHRLPFYGARVPRVGMPGIAFSDGPRGVVVGNATCFPVSMARGATWDPELEERIGDAIGAELRATGANLYGGVCVNILRHPAWGRAQETYGEDPFHVGEMGAALTRGVQRHAMATVKHFAVNSMENARFYVDVEVDEVALHEVYLPHFHRIIDEGVACVMSAYNQLNGTYCGDHRALLTDILRGEWGFEGFVISDWILGLRDAGESVAAGLDIEMPYRMVRAEHIEEALDTGTCTWGDVDAAVTRVVATLLRFDSVLSTPPPSRSVIRATKHIELSREVARRSIVLLRNEPVGDSPLLPLDQATTDHVVVIGALADRINLGDGGSSDVYPFDAVTPLAGLRAVEGLNVAFDDGSDPERSAAAAAQADTVIVVVGYTAEDEGEYIGDAGVDVSRLFPTQDDPELAAEYEAAMADVPQVVVPDHVVPRETGMGFSRGGDRSSLRLREHDEQLILAVADANPRTVVVIEAGSAVVISGWHDEVAAIVQPFYGGEQAGHGLVDVLFGRENPSARLPFTVPTDESHLPLFDREADHIVYDRWHGWWRAERLGETPAYPFGFGLSYTTFELSDVKCVVVDDDIVIDGSIANTGDRDGAEIVQVYATLADTDAPRRLVGFARVEAVTGGATPVVIRVPLDRLSTRDPVAHSWVGPSGGYRVTVARHVADPDALEFDVDLP